MESASAWVYLSISRILEVGSQWTKKKVLNVWNNVNNVNIKQSMNANDEDNI